MALVLTLGLLVAGTLPSLAQEKTQESAQSGPLNFIIKEEDKKDIDFDKLFDAMPEDIRVELAKEAEQQYNQCTTKATYSKYYDCKCIAEEFLHARIMQGPEIASQNLIREVTLKCPYIEGIAGMQYKRCEQLFEMDVVFDLEKFCTCYANSIAKNFAKKPSLHSQYINLLSGRAMSECGYDEDTRKYEKLQKQQQKIR